MTQVGLQFEPKTKRDLLRDALLSGRRMSKQEILREFGIWNSGHLVWLMRKDGLNVQTEMVEHGENRFAIYYIAQN